MMYYKMINDRMVFSQCLTIQNNEGVWISNPTSEMIEEAGWLPYTPPIVPPQPQTEPYTEDIIEAVKRMLEASVEEMTDEQALDVAALFPTWSSMIGSEVAVGERLWYDGKLYKVVQAHTASAVWTPDHTPALYVEISIEEFPEWRQPLGSEDGYDYGDKVSHNGLHWQSTYEGKNVWEPGAVGTENLWSQLS